MEAGDLRPDNSNNYFHDDFLLREMDRCTRDGAWKSLRFLVVGSLSRRLSRPSSKLERTTAADESTSQGSGWTDRAKEDNNTK